MHEKYLKERIWRMDNKTPRVIDEENCVVNENINIFQA